MAASSSAERVAQAALGALLVAIAPRVATAGDACDAGNVCPDRDNDGFAACGCPWSGTPCDCDDADPATYPGAPEACDATKDQNCSGVAPDRCSKKKACLASVCVAECVSLADFGCPPGSVMMTQPDGGPCLCKPSDCEAFGCPAGLTCDESKNCVPSCNANVRCPAGQICRGFGCVDPCADIVCPDGAVCQSGKCSPSCACNPGASCAASESCDVSANPPRCVEPACVGVRCAAGSKCEHGACVDDCDGVACPPKRVCRKVSVNGAPGTARCVDLCTPNPCASDYRCDWRTGECIAPPPDDRFVSDPSNAAARLEVAGAGWLCNITAVSRHTALTAVASCSALVVFVVRRRRRRRRRELRAK